MRMSGCVGRKEKAAARAGAAATLYGAARRGKDYCHRDDKERKAVKNTDLGLAILLVVLGLWSIYCATDTAAAAALAGALFGGAAILLGNWINRLNESRKAREELRQRRSSLEKLIAAELVIVASRYLNAKARLDIALSAGVPGSFAPFLDDVSRYLPPGTPLTSTLGAELLILEDAAIDALATFQGNLAMTRMNVDQAMKGTVSLLDIMLINNLIAHDMGILAECFERIVPDRELRMPGKQQPELASKLLRRVAAGNE